MQDLTNLLDLEDLIKKTKHELSNNADLRDWYECLELIRGDIRFDNPRISLVKRKYDYLKLTMEIDSKTYSAYEKLDDLLDFNAIKCKLFKYLYDKDNRNIHISLDDNNIVEGILSDYISFSCIISNTKYDFLIPIVTTIENAIHDLKLEIIFRKKMDL
jgi:hypothetical protein